MAPSANTRRHSYDPRNDNHVINTFVCPVVRDFVTAMMRVSHRLWPVAAIAGGGVEISGMSIMYLCPCCYAAAGEKVTDCRPCVTRRG